MMKTAIFLGAGASSEDGAPLQSEIFNKYFGGLRRAGLSQEDDEERALIKYFQRMFGIDVAACDSHTLFPTFEEAIGVLDLAVMRDEAYKEFTNHEIRSLRHYIIKLMTRVISDQLDKPQEHHKQLVQNLIRCDKLRETIIVSTNYDILIDNALALHSQEFGLDYGIDFANVTARSCSRPEAERSIMLYKFHGSLNWLYCPICNTIELTPFQDAAIYPANCHLCGSQFSTLIVPPTYFKSLTNVYLGMVWVKAELALREVRHLIFCGYSFPDVDMHIKYLIKRIQSYRRHDLFITVINNYDGKTDESREEEENRFRRFLGMDVDYTDLCFGEFAADPLKYWEIGQ